MNISFCGCGFLGIYHVGTIKALTRHAPKLTSRIQKVGGASAGSLSGCLLACDSSKIDAGRQFNIDLADKIRKKPLGALTPNYNLLDDVREFLEGAMPEDGFRKATNVLHISLTTFDGLRYPHNQVISTFTSNEDLIQCLLASCYIPVYAGVSPPVIRDKRRTDGGLTNNLVTFKNGRTITVSPFCGNQDIMPADENRKIRHIRARNQTFRVNSLNGQRLFHALFPPSNDTLVDYYNRGFKDAVNFLKREGYFESTENGR